MRCGSQVLGRRGDSNPEGKDVKVSGMSFKQNGWKRVGSGGSRRESRADSLNYRRRLNRVSVTKLFTRFSVFVHGTRNLGQLTRDLADNYRVDDNPVPQITSRTRS